ncbi:MAG TPA: diguanylate cyclase [Steroidobacteraceae bacterium]|nr:diguanylate cyclase [Steroidobacteraceae bacterium]
MASRSVSWLLGLAVCLPGVGLALAIPPAPTSSSGTPLAAEVLESTGPAPTVTLVTSGAFDQHFRPFQSRGSHRVKTQLWFRLPAPEATAGGETPVVLVRSGMDQPVELFVRRGGVFAPLRAAAVAPKFGGGQDTVFALNPAPDAGTSLYARVSRTGDTTTDLQFATSTLEHTLESAAGHSRMICFAFGALMAMALSALLVRFVLIDPLYPLYGALFALFAIYLAYCSGEGFGWPLLSYARPLGWYAWNVPIAVSGAAASLFVREFANLRLFSARVYRAFGWLALGYLVLALSNVLRLVGLATLVAAVGNLMFLCSTVFTLLVSYLAWRRGNRAAGWFLIAWALMCTFQFATAAWLLTGRADNADAFLCYGLAPSMVAGAVLIALGVADRMRAQNVALTEAERRAQIDALTGVLNRPTLIERFDTACLRMQRRGLPISVLFIDLDHFKQINDTCGHAAGDACLAAVVAPIQAELRQSDIIGRYGGEEFVVVLNGADASAAAPVAQRICQGVSAVRIEGFAASIRLTCSIGVASSDTLGMWGQHLIAHADAAQYAAKRAGRNQVQQAALAA